MYGCLLQLKQAVPNVSQSLINIMFVRVGITSILQVGKGAIKKLTLILFNFNPFKWYLEIILSICIREINFNSTYLANISVWKIKNPLTLHFLYTIFHIKNYEKKAELLLRGIMLTPVYVISKVGHIRSPSQNLCLCT